MVRYRESVQMLNNIRKVCILPDMPMVGLTHKRGVSSEQGAMRSLSSAATWRRAASRTLHRSMVWNFAPAGLPA
jgi:hypothetical protein